MVRFLPVIHVISPFHAATQTAIARSCGADGVWLINHHISATNLWKAFEVVREEFPDFWIGVNFLDLDAFHAMSFVCQEKTCNGLWTDDSKISDLGVHQTATLIRQRQIDSDWPGEYFGGVAFKSQKPVRSPAEAARNAVPWMDVVTTSGNHTGVAPDLDKIRLMRAETPKLAVASGITPDNTHLYLPYATHLMVATGISKSFTELDPVRTSKIATIVANHVQNS